MTEEEYEIARARASKEIMDEENRTGRFLSEIEYFSTVYEKVFCEPASFEYELSDDAKIEILARCLQKWQPMSQLSEHELLKLQYKYQFDKNNVERIIRESRSGERGFTPLAVL